MKRHNNPNHLISRLSILIIFCIITLFLTDAGVYYADAKEPKRGGELVASLYATPHHLNPAIQSGIATAVPGAQIFAGLVRFDNELDRHQEQGLVRRLERIGQEYDDQYLFPHRAVIVGQ